MEVSEDLVTAYKAARYSVLLPMGRRLPLVIGERCQELEDVLQQWRFSMGAFITPENPRSEVFNAEDNAERCQRFLKDLCSQGSEECILGGQGGDALGEWLPEKSFFFPVENERMAERLANDYGQNAYLVIEVGEPVKLILCHQD